MINLFHFVTCITLHYKIIAYIVFKETLGKVDNGMNVSNEKAFTIVEILIVAVIIGILATIAIPRMDFVFSKDKLRASTSSVTSYLYLARMKAVNEGEEYGVQFFENGTFHMLKDPRGVSEVIGAPHRLENGVTFVEMTFEDWLVVFNEYGQLVKSCLPAGNLTGSIILTSDSGDSTMVEVTFITGRIRETNI